jgi:hypothetical protein
LKPLFADRWWGDAINPATIKVTFGQGADPA